MDLRFINLAPGSTTSPARAIAAAHAATDAAAELLRFAREGAAGHTIFGVEDPVAWLVDALLLTVRLERDDLEPRRADPDVVDQLDQLGDLASALTRWQIDAGAKGAE